jgi:hypothetical protein
MLSFVQTSSRPVYFQHHAMKVCDCSESFAYFLDACTCKTFSIIMNIMNAEELIILSKITQQKFDIN